jgi:hypothetical protein
VSAVLYGAESKVRVGLTTTVQIRHDETLANMGLHGRRFTQKYENQVTEIKQLFLDFMKSLRQKETVRSMAGAEDNADTD